MCLIRHFCTFPVTVIGQVIPQFSLGRSRSWREPDPRAPAFDRRHRRKTGSKVGAGRVNVTPEVTIGMVAPTQPKQ